MSNMIAAIPTGMVAIFVFMAAEKSPYKIRKRWERTRKNAGGQTWQKSILLELKVMRK